MVTIQQVQLLESRVIKAIEYVDQVTEENTLLKNKLDSCQSRVDELEVLIQRFKEEQGKIEEGILSALDRLNKFDPDDKQPSQATDNDIAASPEEAVPSDAPTQTSDDVAASTAEQSEPAGEVS
jgi:predicted nuclease with TOPRIM domain